MRGAPPTKYTLTLNSVRASNSMYIVSIVPKFELRLLPMSGHLFISLHGLGSLTLVSPDFDVTYHSILS